MPALFVFVAAQAIVVPPSQQRAPSMVYSVLAYGLAKQDGAREAPVDAKRGPQTPAVR
jgi:hypothetical protein